MTSRFAIAVHLMGMVAWSEGAGVTATSDKIAGSVGTHAVVVRRVLAALGRAELVQTRRGAGGGTRLARPADTITLRHVYEALEDEETLFHTTRSGPNEQCPVGQHMSAYLDDLFVDIEDTLKRRLEQTTIAEIRDGISAHLDGICGGGCPDATAPQGAADATP